jgi:hypothetical protein
MLFDERPHGRTFDANAATASRLYFCSGEQNEAIVYALASASIPPFVTTPIGLLYRQPIQLRETGHALFDITAPYGRRKREVGSSSFSFDTGGATVNVKVAKQHLASYPIDGDLHKGAIGVKADGTVEGADMIIPACRMMYTFRHPLGQIGEYQAVTLARATGKTNANTFRGFAAGELLFAGASGSDGTESEAELTYNIIASENATITMGDIAGIVKPGHAYAWAEFENEIAGGAPVVRPKAVHVEIVYGSIDFASVFGWS